MIFQATGRDLTRNFPAPECKWSTATGEPVDNPTQALREAGRLDEAFALVDCEGGDESEVIDVYEAADWERIEAASPYLIGPVDAETAAIVPVYQIVAPSPIELSGGASE